MHRILITFLLTTVLISCQTSRHQNGVTQAKLKTGYRHLASADAWASFITRFAQEAKMSEAAVEQAMIKFLQKKSATGVRSNFANAGIKSEDQALRITSLNDDLPYMPKVRKWTLENMDKIFPAFHQKNKGTISKIYEEIIINERGLRNNYNFRPAKRSERRKALNPYKSLDEKSAQLNQSITDVRMVEQQKILRLNLSISKTRGTSSPAVYANGQIIVESAALISQKSGKWAMKDGCKNFMDTASPEVLEIKANIDLYTAELIEQMAYNKAGRRFASHKNIKNPELLLTEAEIDQARILAFQKVKKISKKRATKALKRLKGKPCRIY